MVFARKLQGQAPALAQGQFWQQVKHELAAYVTNLDEPAANAWQVQTLYRERADAENVFDELKNQWGFNGFCARSRRVSALAARLLLLVYNLWSLFVRLLEPTRQVEAAGSRRWFLVIAARLVESGRQKPLQVSVQGATQDWLHPRRPVAGRNCAAVENPPASSASNHPRHGMKT